MTLTLARELHNACPRCPQVTFHNGAPCPLWASAKERPYSVPCSGCRAGTFRNDAFCDRCRPTSSAGRRVGDRGLAPSVPTSSPAGASRTATHPSPVGGSRT